MSEVAAEPPYRLEKDSEERISAIYRCADGAEVPIDDGNCEYCSFVTWAANQKSPVALGFDQLEPDSLYAFRDEQVIAYCKQHGVVLFCHDLDRPGKFQFVTDRLKLTSEQPIALEHGPAKGSRRPFALRTRSFFRLYKAIPERGASAAEGVDGLIGERLPVFVGLALLNRLEKLLADENSEIRCLSCCPVQRTFVYVDVSGFSQHPVGHQLLILNSLIKITNEDRFWSDEDVEYRQTRVELEANLCIGDGYIFAFRQPWAAVFFAGYLAALIESLIARKLILEFHFRMSVHTGLVHRFWDRLVAGQDQGRWNYVGRGITDGERVLSAIGKDQDDVVFLSAETRRELMSVDRPLFARFVPPLLQNRGRRADKHGVFRRLYELNHTGWLGDVAERVVGGVGGMKV